VGCSGPCFSCCWSVMGLMAAHGVEDDVVVVTSAGRLGC
jgi:predicted metal-binding membrane protein